ncbi:Dynein light chain 1, cytoplasmic [Tritrichomonas foetus]|uniref:Dynein light chain n=1 Tax=Tritrichomonas foetus TaxID=1144522 RepID=A0A1J4L5D7_9EUKA|nr:Dynein light chain 1, cytoplasmic [Tritrichomonas foetus]|eukprot:OHT17149.1 Dynein light chain 1, cytoplasmic [Tritrichomonas foetus]
MTSKEEKTVPESKGNDMDAQWKKDVQILFKKAIQSYQTENEIAKYLKTNLQNKHSGMWHCVVGRDFGSSVVFEEKTHFCEQIGPFHIELWRCGK